MANRQRTSVTTAGRVSRRLPGQTASNTSAPAESVAQRAGRRVAVWLLEQGAADSGDRKATLSRTREEGRALRNPGHLRARPPSPQAGSKMDEATLESRGASLREAIRSPRLIVAPQPSSANRQTGGLSRPAAPNQPELNAKHRSANYHVWSNWWLVRCALQGQWRS